LHRSYFVADTKRSATCIGASDGVMAAIPFDKIDHLHEEDAELAIKLQRAMALANMEKHEQSNHRNTIKLVNEYEKQLSDSRESTPDTNSRPISPVLDPVKEIRKNNDNCNVNNEEEPKFEEVEEDDGKGGKIIVKRKITNKIAKKQQSKQKKRKRKTNLWNRAKVVVKDRKKIVGRGVIKREKKSFLGSSNTEIFYRNLVAKHKKDAEEKHETTKELEEQVEKQKKKLVSEKVLRRRQIRLLKEMEAEILDLKERLKKYEEDSINEVEEDHKGLALLKKSAKKILFGVQVTKN
jgi:hypothetical protein